MQGAVVHELRVAQRIDPVVEGGANVDDLLACLEELGGQPLGAFVALGRELLLLLRKLLNLLLVILGEFTRVLCVHPLGLDERDEDGLLLAPCFKRAAHHVVEAALAQGVARLGELARALLLRELVEANLLLGRYVLGRLDLLIDHLEQLIGLLLELDAHPLCRLAVAFRIEPLELTDDLKDARLPFLDALELAALRVE